MPIPRNTDYVPHKWGTVSEPLSNEGFLLFILSSIGNTPDFRTNILGAISTLTHPETWQGNQEIASAYAQLEIFMVDFCDKVAECIENSSAVQTALLEYIEQLPTSQGGTGLGQVLPPSTLETSILGTCDNDNLYAACTQLVDFMNSAITDFLEIVEAGTGRLERMNVTVSAIPIIGILPLDEGLLFLDQLIENFTANYAAQYTTTLRDEYACELFCIAQENCGLTFEQMLDYFESKAIATFDRVSLTEAIDWFVFGTWTGDLIVHGMHALFAWSILWGSEFFGVNLNRIVRMVQAASNDSDNDWLIKCDDCNEPLIELELGYAPCAVNNVGLGANFELFGASPIDSAWTRYIAKPVANAAPVLGYDYGFSVTEKYDRSFTLKSVGFHSGASGGADGYTCNGATYDNNLPSFGTTVTDVRYGVQIVTNTLSPVYYVDILV